VGWTYRFGEFELDGPRFELRRGGAPVHVQRKALDVLLYLIRRRDRVVSRDELFAELWRGVAVTEASLDKAMRLVRLAIGDAGSIQRRVATVRGRGFRFIAPVEEIATPEDGGFAPAPDPAAGFIGRADVLTAIASALRGASTAGGRLVLLAGEAGMGKTRTALEAVARARAGGVQVLAGWCQQGEGAPSLWPWLHLLRPLAAGVDASMLRDLGEGARLLAAWLPELQRLLPDASPVSSLDPEAARFRLLDTIAEMLKRSARERVHLVLLDDLHWADRASLTLLDMLARDLPDTRLLVLATYRPDDLADGHPLLALARRPECETVVLRGLERPEVGRLVALVRGEQVDDALIAAIHERTQGNPFFVRELARALGSGTTAEPAGGVPALPRLPSGVREVLRTRLAGLSRACRSALAVAATVGRAFDVALLARALDEDPERALALLDEARAAHVLERSGDAYAFTHALVREALLEDAPASQQAQLHWRVGEALRALAEDEDADRLGEIARHLAAGAPAGDAALAIDYARRAGDHAARLLACDEAADHYRRALGACDLLATPDRSLRCELLLALGAAQVTGGQPTEGRATLRRAGDLARGLGHARHLARAAIASGGLEFSPDTWVEEADLVAQLEEALAMLPADERALRVRLLVRLSIALTWSNDLARAAALAREAVALARGLDDADALARALYVRRWSLLGPTDLPARLAIAGEILGLARRTTSRELELAARSCCFLDRVELGRIDEADRDLVEYERLASELRVPRYRWRAQFYRGMRLVLAGRFTEAEEAVGRILAVERGFRPADAGLVSATQLIILRLEQARLAEVEPAVRAACDRFPNVPAWQAALALVHSELGRASEAHAIMERLAVEEFRALPRNLLWLATMVILGESAGNLADGPRAGTLYEILLPYVPRTLVIGAGVVCMGSLDLFLGRLAATAGDRRAAARHLTAAHAMNTRMGAQPWTAWADYELARLAADEKDRKRRARGRERLARAQEAASRLGLIRLGVRATALAPQLA
jgi:DNA-binding winged helix-turn-helix (wHTH) protein